MISGRKIARVLFGIIVLFIVYSMMKSASFNNAPSSTDTRLEITELGDGTVRIDRLAFNENDSSITIPETAGTDQKTVSALGRDAFKIPIKTGRDIEKRSRNPKGPIVRVNTFHEVVLSDNLKVIEGNPFSDCGELETITVPEGNKRYSVTDGLLIDQETNTLVACVRTAEGTVDIPEGVVSIGERAFYFCQKIEAVTLPSSLERIGDEAFAYCLGIKQLSIPQSVTEIGTDPFKMCGNPYPGQDALLKYGDEKIKDSYPFKIIAAPGSAGAQHAEEKGFPLITG